MLQYDNISYDKLSKVTISCDRLKRFHKAIKMFLKMDLVSKERINEPDIKVYSTTHLIKDSNRCLGARNPQQNMG